jgi:hypothetical protein
MLPSLRTDFKDLSILTDPRPNPYAIIEAFFKFSLWGALQRKYFIKTRLVINHCFSVIPDYYYPDSVYFREIFSLPIEASFFAPDIINQNIAVHK